MEKDVYLYFAFLYFLICIFYTIKSFFYLQNLKTFEVYYVFDIIFFIVGLIFLVLYKMKK